MNTIEYINKINDTEIDDKRKKEIEDIYSCKLPEVVAKAISLADSVDFFDEEKRALSYDEIKDGTNTLDYHSTTLNLIPLIDSFDCTYIVYLVDEDKWGKYSSIDKDVFKRRNTLEELLQ